MDGAGRLSDRLGMIAAAIILALGLMIGGYLLGNGLVRAREADRSVTVRGLAERDVTADLATWTLAYSTQGSELGPVQAQVAANTKVIEAFLKDRQSVGSGKSVSVSVDIGGRRIIKKKLQITYTL